MNMKEIAKEFTRQILDPNTNSINFELVTTMLNEMQQTHKEVLPNMDSYRIRHRLIDSTFSARRSQLESINMQISHLNRNLEESSKLFQKSKKSISLASLLDSHNRGRDLSPANQSSGDDGVKKKRKKKKREGG